MNSIFAYKINELKNNIKVGFPNNSLSNNLNIIKEKEINYLIVDGYDIKDKYTFKVNNFKKYSKSVYEIMSINNKINKIVKRVKELEDNELKIIVLDQIENILNEL